MSGGFGPADVGASRPRADILSVMSAPFRPADTTPDAWAKQLEISRRMSPAEKLAAVSSLTLAVYEIALAGLRGQYPSASEAEIRMRLAVRRLGAETVAQVYGWRAPADDA